MPYPNGPASKSKAHSRITHWLSSLVAAVGGRLFAADDTTALQHGWQITVQRGGLGRTYRDPRFGAPRACPQCRGSGHGDGIGCATCGGSGRTARAASPQASYQEDRHP